MIEKLISGLRYFVNERERKWKANKKLEMVIYSIMLFQVVFAFLYISFYDFIVSLPYFIKCIAMAIGSFIYFYSEGTTEGYTFVSDRCALDRKFRPGWSIFKCAPIIYHKWRVAEAVGINLLITSGIAVNPNNTLELIIIIMCSAWAFPFYQYRIAKKFDLKGDK